MHFFVGMDAALVGVGVLAFLDVVDVGWVVWHPVASPIESMLRYKIAFDFMICSRKLLVVK